MSKHKSNSIRIDEENPEWTAADFKRARPARAVLSKLVGKQRRNAC